MENGRKLSSPRDLGAPTASIEWWQTPGAVPYPDAMAKMEDRVAGIAAGQAPETIWLLEHPPLYTAGTSANPSDLLRPKQFPVYETGRGGQYTYHGPGQRVGYVMLDLKNYKQDLRWYVQSLAGWMMATLRELGIESFWSPDRIGVWVKTDRGDEKIGAIGIRIRRWVSFHGFSLNVNPDLSHFNGIVPCGLSEFGVTSLHKLGVEISMAELDQILIKTFPDFFHKGDDHGQTT